ncbi:MAG: MYXO-CTERM sorting domain-containing protein, partial [Myxococcaceae bacterium]
LRDSASGALAPAPYALSANLLSAGLSASFSAGASCATPISSIAFAAGESSKQIYFFPTAVGTASLSASHVDFLPGSAGTSVIQVVPSRLLFVSPPQTRAPGACSAPFELELQDDAGVAVNPGVDSAVSLSTTAGAGALFSDSACTVTADSVSLPAAATRAVFYARSTTPGSYTVTAVLGSYPQALQAWVVTADPLALEPVIQMLSVGCGCSSTDPASLLGVFALLYVVRRRTRA